MIPVRDLAPGEQVRKIKLENSREKKNGEHNLRWFVSFFIVQYNIELTFPNNVVLFFSMMLQRGFDLQHKLFSLNSNVLRLEVRKNFPQDFSKHFPRFSFTDFTLPLGILYITILFFQRFLSRNGRSTFSVEKHASKNSWNSEKIYKSNNARTKIKRKKIYSKRV